jgi:phosphoribosylglycinamide formyltransferase-1
LDAGPILGQATLAVLPEDDEASLQKRIQQLEHQLYPEMIRQWIESNH